MLIFHNAAHQDTHIGVQAAPFRTLIPGKVRLVVNPRVGAHGFWLDAMPRGGGMSTLYHISLSGKILQRIPLPAMSMWEPVRYRHQVITGLGGSFMYFHHGLGNCASGHLHGWTAYNTATGKQTWHRYGLCQTMPTAALQRGILYGVSANGRFEAVNAGNGSRLWRIRKRWSPAMSNPSISGDLAVFGTSRIPVGDVYNPAESVVAVNLRTHRVAWEFTPPNAINLGESTPVIHQGVVYATWYTRRYQSVLPALLGGWVVEKRFHLAALRLRTGKLLWNTLYARSRQTLWARFQEKFWAKPPHITDGPLEYVGGQVLSSPKNTGTLYALSAKTGQVSWARPTYAYNVSLPVLCRGALRFLELHGAHSSLESLNPGTGTVLQQKKLPFIGRMGPGTPICLKYSVLLWGTTPKGIVLQNVSLKGGS